MFWGILMIIIGVPVLLFGMMFMLALIGLPSGEDAALIISTGLLLFIAPGTLLTVFGVKFIARSDKKKRAQRQAAYDAINAASPLPVPPEPLNPVPSPPQSVNPTFKWIDCPGCGAKKQLQSNQTGNCDYCDTLLVNG
ncbi:hypothetical protein [Paenibacillus sp. 2TAB19]|jgi:hypothetical protein|uniref:hypothetical protein n=1 Tax=Paenibacillus sp. 2TAB19 TaxID=3233003 RepID=UPI003F9590EC